MTAFYAFGMGKQKKPTGERSAPAQMGRVVDHERELAWLLEQPDMDVCVGLDPEGWPATVWVLHAMYENPRFRKAGTYEDDKRRRLDAGAPPAIIGDVNLDERTIDVGIPLGQASDPGSGWSRLTWADYLARDGRSVNGPHQTRPGYGWFPPGSWPLSIQPPPEGSMDVASFEALINAIASLETAGRDTECFAFMAGLPSGMDPQDPYHLWNGTLGALPTLWERKDYDYRFSPTNWWPAHRSWFVLTDYDLQATKVSGPERLITRIRNDPFLEIVDWTKP
jgi:hypothetical protein